MSLKGFEVLYGTGELENQVMHKPEQVSLFDVSESLVQQQAIQNIEKSSLQSLQSSSQLPQDSTSFSVSSKTPIQPPISQQKIQSRTASPIPSSSAEIQTITKQELISYWVSHFSQNLKTKFFAFFNEIKVLLLLFLVVLVSFYFFTNAQLIFLMVQDTFSPLQFKNSTVVPESLTHQAAPLQKETKSLLEDLQEKVSDLDLVKTKELAPSLQAFLAQKDGNQTLDFNLLPPTNRLIIPDLNLNVPLVDTDNAGKIDFSDENFDDELERGVVKYPTTPTPGQKWNTLLFGHSSTEWWKKNEYWFVFRHLPRLKVGQRFQVIWNGQLTTYEMVERKVVLPKNVEEYYHLFSEKNESYLTLMGCYPIGTADKRMMVVAKKVED